MSQQPALQTVATLTGGASPVMQQAFFWGIPGRPFSIGTRGDWVVNAPGVEPVHFFLNFDGRMIQVAAGPSGATVTVGGVPIDHSWRPVPVFAEIAFGGARLRITCEEAPQEPLAPPAQPLAPPPTPPPPAAAQPVAPQPTAPQPIAPQPMVTRSIAPQPVAPRPASHPPPTPAVQYGGAAAAAHSPQAPERAAYQRPAQLTTQPIGLTPAQQAMVRAAGPSDGSVTRPFMPAPVLPRAGVGPSQPPPTGEIHTLHSMASPGFDPRSSSSSLPAVVTVPPTSFAAGTSAGTPPPGRALELGMTAAGPSRFESDDVPAVSTLSDAGALRALASRVQTEPAGTRELAEAYFAEVQRAAFGQQPPAAGSPAPRNPSGAPGAFSPAGPRLTPNPGDPALDDANATKPEKPKTSWVMRVVMVLLPIAGYFAIFWEPPAPPPAPSEEQSTSTEATSTPTASVAARPSASAPVPAVASAAASATPSASVAAASDEAPARPASGTAVVAPVPSALAAGGILPLSTTQARDALNAAFEGKMEEAVQRYEKLATGPDGETYRVSARLIRERALRKP